MASDKEGGVSIQGSGSVSVGGDIVGRDKITKTVTQTTTGIDAAALAEWVAAMQKINQRIDAAPNLDVDEKKELKETVQKLEEEVKKGDEAKPGKVERWLKFIAGMSEDILDVTVAAFTNPALGVVEAVRKVAQKVKEEEAAKKA